MKIHFIAIGGSIMHQLAIQLKKQGHKVTGSDDVIFDPALTNLKKEGICPEAFGWFPEKLTDDIDMVVLGKHAHGDNVELAEAKKKGLKLVTFPELMYEHAKDKIRIVVAGSHGKTTTTSMIIHTLLSSGVDCDYLVGAKIEGVDGSVKLSKEAKYVVIEGDEYSTSADDLRPKFVHYHPDITIITGIAWDHANIFKTEEDYIKVFEDYIKNLSKDCKVIYCKEDPILNDLVEKLKDNDRFIPYKAHPFENIDGKTFLKLSDRNVGTDIFGKHNMQNLCAAKKVSKIIGLDSDKFYVAAANFKGAAKRLELLFDKDDLIIYKDYAHSPSKVRATVKAVKEKHPNKKLVAFAELHTYSSLNASFLPQYKNALDAADVSIVHYDPEAMKIKRMPDLPGDLVRKAFDKADLFITNNSKELYFLLDHIDFEDAVLLLMSSGAYGGLDLNTLPAVISKKNKYA